MAVTVAEKFISRRLTAGTNPLIEAYYIVEGTDDESTAKTALQAATPPFADGYARRDITVTQMIDLETWEGYVTYGPQGGPGDLLYQFETTGGTQHITHSRNTVATYSATTDFAPNFHGAINVSADGTVQGLDIVTPVYQWSESHYFVASDVTPAFRANLFYLTGMVNSAPFGDCGAGEALFLGASGTRRGGPAGPDWIITFRFAASPNATPENNLLVIQPFGQITKAGWDYVWVYYQPSSDGTAHMSVMNPVALYVEQVYSRGNFGALGIPTSPYVP